VINVFDDIRVLQLEGELKMLYKLDCSSVVRFYAVYRSQNRVHLVLEHMDLGSLLGLIHQQRDPKPVPESVAAAMLYQMLWGVAYLHRSRALHRDVKPSNIVLNRAGELKLADFGIAKEFGADELTGTMAGTFKYMSPERLRGDVYGTAADVWSLGLVLLEIVTRRQPFEACSNQLDLNELLEEDKIADYIPYGAR
jgi:serine/threonine protein kinase